MLKMSVFISCQSWKMNLNSMKVIGFVTLTITLLVTCAVNKENKQALGKISFDIGCLLLTSTKLC